MVGCKKTNKFLTIAIFKTRIHLENELFECVFRRIRGRLYATICFILSEPSHHNCDEDGELPSYNRNNVVQYRNLFIHQSTAKDKIWFHALC